MAALTDEQRLSVLEWVAEGLTTEQCNKKARAAKPPFEVTAQQLHYFRKTYGVLLSELRTERELEALTTGLAVKANRLERLCRLAAALERDLYDKKLIWTAQVKGIGSGSDFERVTFEEFNASEIKELRGVYDDIAKETGGRVTKSDITTGGRPIKGYVLVNPGDWPDVPETPSTTYSSTTTELPTDNEQDDGDQ